MAVNIRLSNYTKEVSNSLDAFTRVVQVVRQRLNFPILVVPIALSAGDSDLAAGAILAQRMPDADIRVLDQSKVTARVVKSILGNAKIAVGVSYHFAIFALQGGTPVISAFDGAYYAQKANCLASIWPSGCVALDLSIAGDAAIVAALERLGGPEVRKEVIVRSEEMASIWRSSTNNWLQPRPTQSEAMVASK